MKWLFIAGRNLAVFAGVVATTAGCDANLPPTFSFGIYWQNREERLRMCARFFSRLCLPDKTRIRWER